MPDYHDIRFIASAEACTPILSDSIACNQASGCFQQSIAGLIVFVFHS
jgi:hypothetical protein